VRRETRPGRQPDRHRLRKTHHGAHPGRRTLRAITLASPGSVTLSSIGIRFTAVRATAQDYQGWFDSSSQALTGSGMTALTPHNSMNYGDTLPPPWQITGGRWRDGGSIGVLRAGSTWTDYTMTFDIRVWTTRRGGWCGPVRRPRLPVLLDDATDSAGAPDTLGRSPSAQPSSASSGQVALPVVVTAGSWHGCRQRLRGPRSRRRSTVGGWLPSTRRPCRRGHRRTDRAQWDSPPWLGGV